jgi:hypothetical protein
MIFSSQSDLESKDKEKLWNEFPVSGMFSINFSASSVDEAVSFYPWKHLENVYIDEPRVTSLDIFHKQFPEKSPFHAKRCLQIASVSDFIEHLSESVRRRALSVKRDQEQKTHIAILFSGGIDSLIIAALADIHVPEGETIDLVNVAFGNDPLLAPDRQTGINAFLELRRLNPTPGRWKFVEVNLRQHLYYPISEYHNSPNYSAPITQ